MAIPSGTGSEVLKRAGGVRANNGVQIFTVGTGKIHTVLSIVAFASQSHSSTVKISITLSSTEYLLAQQIIPGLGTYVFNDKLVCHPTDMLKIEESENYNMNYWVTWIEQDFGA